MKRFSKSLAVAALAAGAISAPVLACGGGWMGVNLVATAGVKASLRSAFLAAHPRLAAGQVAGPVAGRTYYGDYSGTRYAVATFVAGSAPAYPTIFSTDERGRWHVRRQTHGGICTDYVPVELIGVWSLEHWGGRCYVEPVR
jgi:hypothetical protein